MNKNNQTIKIIMLATACDLSNIIYTHLSENFSISKILIEKPISKQTILKKRIKKIGLVTVAGQLLFMLLVAKPLRLFSSKRKKNILRSHNIVELDIPTEKIVHITSVNDQETINLIQKENPDLILVNGTRIISEEVINATKARFINIHAGITPLYRGVHGGYWALAMNDKEHCGVTIHYVDKGIDTGKILAQAIIHPQKNDNFITYPYLQFSIGAQLFAEAIQKFNDGKLEEKQPPKGVSKLWYHPTLWQYLYYRISKGIK